MAVLLFLSTHHVGRTFLPDACDVVQSKGRSTWQFTHGANPRVVGEQTANIINWFTPMARRPHLRNEVAGADDLRKPEIMSPDDLKQLRSSLSRLSRAAALQAYHTAYARCRMVNDRVPSARSIQELVQVWKQLWKRR